MNGQPDLVSKRPRRRVVKVGGSLLATSAIERLPAWLRCQPSMQNVLVVGGGPHVDAIRQRQKTSGCTDAEAHWQSIAAMAETAAVVANRLATHQLRTSEFDSEVRIVESLRLLCVPNPPPVVILDVESFLRQNAEQTDALPQNWTVTSDSIAAKIADALRADELVLLKSTLPTNSTTVPRLVDEGIVDEHFHHAIASTNLRVVNARESDWLECHIDGTPPHEAPPHEDPSHEDPSHEDPSHGDPIGFS